MKMIITALKGKSTKSSNDIAPPNYLSKISSSTKLRNTNVLSEMPYIKSVDTPGAFLLDDTRLSKICAAALASRVTCTPTACLLVIHQVAWTPLTSMVRYYPPEHFFIPEDPVPPDIHTPPTNPSRRCRSARQKRQNYSQTPTTLSIKSDSDMLDTLSNIINAIQHEAITQLHQIFKDKMVTNQAKITSQLKMTLQLVVQRLQI